MASDLPSPEASVGAYAATLIQGRLRRLVALQAEVLADQEQEPLHHMRVTCRQLQITLHQFGPALTLPDPAAAERLAKVGRRLGCRRDLDVLQQRLEQGFGPQLPEKEAEVLRKLLKQLRRERKLAFEAVEEGLKGRRYLKLLAQLQGWLRQPQTTRLGEQPMRAWWGEFCQGAISGLVLEPGWQLEQPDGPEAQLQLHQLRKRLKRCRYGLANLEPLRPEALAPWLERLRAMQQHLGDLHDLQLLDQALNRQFHDAPDRVAPCLCSLLLEARDQAWQAWRQQADGLLTAAGRDALQRLPLEPAAG
ncbi:MAG: CHAD domain-containing protein [Synechococcaceae bacterium WBB_10_009]|nr:CHAD domain-containing protein [Synechococcaceae bacterium WBB_10_009]